MPRRKLKGKGVWSAIKSAYNYLHKHKPLSKAAELAGLIPHPYAQAVSEIGAPLLKMAGLGRKRKGMSNISNKKKMQYVRSFKK